MESEIEDGSQQDKKKGQIRKRENLGNRPEGFMTIVHPAAIAAPAFLASIALGKFHGEIAPTTPTGSFWTTTLRVEGSGKREGRQKGRTKGKAQENENGWVRKKNIG